jgi:ABC-type transporter Mla maintaining outer membrane lipid asymmetry ATPase subunit MlaF
MLHEGRMVAMGPRQQILASTEPVIRQFFARSVLPRGREAGVWGVRTPERSEGT